MSFNSGVANSISEVLSALQSACVDAGWTLTGSVLHKGTCYAKVSVDGLKLLVLGGTGLTGSTLTGFPSMVDGTPLPAALKSIGADDIAYPASYDIHVHDTPDEVYLVLNFSVNKYLWLAFGQSPVTGISGTGNWQGASCAENGGSDGVGMSVAEIQSNTLTPAGLGWCYAVGGYVADNDAQNFRVHHGLDGNSWSSAGGTAGAKEASEGLWSDGPSSALSAAPLFPLLQRSPSAWDGSTVLLEMQGWINRNDDKLSMVCDMGHARHCRVNNYAPRDIKILGSDKWMIYPWYVKNADFPEGAPEHTGTYGWAIRYDGP